MTTKQHHPLVAAKCFHSNSQLNAEGGTKSLIEKAVDRVKEKKLSTIQNEQLVADKPPLLKRLWDGVIHTITGFRLFAKDVRLSTKYLVRSLRGQQLSRRESQLVSTQ